MSFESMTRRSALLTVGGGISTLLAWPESLVAAEAVPSFSFILVSDTHLGRKDNKAAQQSWVKTAKELSGAKGDFIIHLGDVIDGGREKQYPVYLDVRKTIEKPIHEIPGNHDPQEAFAKHLRKKVDFSFDHQGVRFLLINNSRRDSHDGFLQADQLTWINKQCESATKKNLFIVLCAHVPVHTNRHPDRGWYVKPKDGQQELYRILLAHRKHVLGMFHGHFHNGVRGWEDHAPLFEICCPSALYNQSRKLMEQKAPGYNLPEFRPGYVKVTFSKNGMKLDYQPVGVEKATSKQVKLTQFS